MLTLTRKVDEGIKIGTSIVVNVKAVYTDGLRVRIGVEAPQHVRILRVDRRGGVEGIDGREISAADLALEVARDRIGEALAKLRPGRGAATMKRVADLLGVQVDLPAETPLTRTALR